MPDPYTLKEDIYKVLNERHSGDFTEEIAQFVGQNVTESLLRQFGPNNRDSGRLRLSSIGTQCERKLWYSVNQPTEAAPLEPHVVNKFIFGDLTESYILGLVMAAGHIVSGLQDPVDVCGIRGHRDCIIDGMLFDVKSASSRSMDKFRGNGLRRDDPFGYLSQLSSYLYGSQSDPAVTHKTKAGFLAFDKQFGQIEVDIYDLTEDLEFKEQEVNRKVRITKGEIPDRPFEPVPDGKSGNTKLPTICSYCDYKHTCWPDLRTFAYSSGPRFLTTVVKTPEVPEVT